MSFVQLDSIPQGVEILREYPRLQGTLVHCKHAGVHRFHAWGRPACRVCKADESMTEGFMLPVKMIVALAPGASQGSLFG